MRNASPRAGERADAPPDRGAWWHAALAALLGLGLAIAGLELLGPAGFPAALIATLLGAGVSARVIGRRSPREVVAFTLAALMLTWPLLLTLILLLFNGAQD